MRITTEEMMDKLGVGYVIGPYETCPWSFYDEEQGITCAAEVRMGPDGDDVEAEVQMLYDDPPEGKSSMEPVCYIKATKASSTQWLITKPLIRGKPHDDDKIKNLEDKGMNFFMAIVQEIKMEKLPDIDQLIQQELHNRERAGGSAGQGGGGKSPRMKGAQLMGMTRGGGI